MARSYKHIDKFKDFNKDYDTTRRVHPYRRTKFRLDDSSLDS